MIIVILIVLGLALGSFVNALVWRLHEQEIHKGKKSDNKRLDRLSISKGRSMCPHCKHKLSALDLVPVISWLTLGGKCRYCGKTISIQYPVVELLTAATFIISYLSWPEPLQGAQIALFVLWLAMVVGLIALLVYDLKWMILPDRIIVPLGFIAGAMAIITIAIASDPLRTVISTVLSVAIGGGIFYVLFQVSDGKWIGGGDVKLGWVIGLFLTTPAQSFLMIFMASLIGCLVSLPLLLVHRLKKESVIPFGPFLIVAAMLVQLYGHTILQWYQRTFLPFTT